MSVLTSEDISDCRDDCTSRTVCTAFTYDHSTKMCWKYLHTIPEVSFNIVFVDYNVTTMLKEGFVGMYKCLVKLDQGY